MPVCDFQKLQEWLVINYQQVCGTNIAFEMMNEFQMRHKFTAHRLIIMAQLLSPKANTDGISLCHTQYLLLLIVLNLIICLIV